MARRTIADIEKIWANVEGVKKLSDRVIGIGPVGFGMDALLTWVPVVGTAYTVGTAGWLMWQATRAKASPAVLARMAAYMAVDTATGTVYSDTGDGAFTAEDGEQLLPGAQRAAGRLLHLVDDLLADGLDLGIRQRQARPSEGQREHRPRAETGMRPDHRFRDARQACHGEAVIDAGGQIGRRVDERPVEIEKDRFRRRHPRCGVHRRHAAQSIVRTILPTWEPSSMRRWAFATSAKGTTVSMTGLTRPSASTTSSARMLGRIVP